jgi:predicted GIY-YIG superfamily endonuclease
MAWYVYVLKNEIDGRLYKGMTEDIDVRIKVHNLGKSFIHQSISPLEISLPERMPGF